MKERASRRVRQLRKWFGIETAHPAWGGGHLGIGPGALAGPLPTPRPGQIVLITGPSGSGKSRLLAALRRTLKGRWIDLARLRVPRRAVADLFSHTSMPRSLRLLARVGLAEAHCFIATPRRLSVGQRWRLRLAMALEQLSGVKRGATLLCDEFAAPLDRITTAVVCQLLRRQVSKRKLSAIVVSVRDDLAACLEPDVIVSCDFGRITVKQIVQGVR
jgi:ABC-type ATPase with predicted acetyltransferase domain